MKVTEKLALLKNLMQQYGIFYRMFLTRQEISLFL